MSNSIYLEFRDWLNRINQSEVIPADLSAFNFGLFQTPNGYSIYLIGSTIFTEDNDDWAGEEDFAPREKYFELPSNFKDKNWKELEDFVKELVIDFINSEDFQKTFLARTVAITVGFDDGDLIRIK